MKVSAIIPTFNTAPFVSRAVQSCLDISDVFEVIVIDDGSTDDTLEVLRHISDHRFILLTHHDGLNHGRSASRNLGINKAKGEWIIFCDADDFCLPHRLTHLFKKDHTNIDGYYDLIEARTEDPALKDDDILKHQGILEQIRPENLFDHLVSNKESWFNIAGLTIRKSAIERVGYFDEALTIAEDTDIIWRLAQSSIIVSGEADSPIAVRWVHPGNSYQDVSSLNRGRYKFYKKWKNLLPGITLSKQAKDRINDAYRYYHRRMLINSAFNWFNNK